MEVQGPITGATSHCVTTVEARPLKPGETEPAPLVQFLASRCCLAAPLRLTTATSTGVRGPVNRAGRPIVREVVIEFEEPPDKPSCG